MSQFFNIIMVLLLVAITACTKHSSKADLSTPEGAILSLEEAYRQHDIDRAVACKDFKVEAAYMARDKPALGTSEAVDKIAKVLELAYRAEMKSGFPEFNGVSSTFSEKKDIGDGKVVVTEVCKFRDGTTSSQDIMVAKTDSGWKVMIPVKQDRQL